MLPKIPDIKAEKIYFILLCLIAIALPWPMIWGNIAVIILVAFTLFSGEFESKWRLLKASFVPVLLCSFFFMLSLFGMIFTQNTKAGLFLLEKRLALLLIPLVVFSMKPLQKEKIGLICSYFIYSCYASMIFCLLLASYRFFILYTHGFINYNIFTVDLISPLGISHVYFGMYLAFSLLFLTENYTDSFSDKDISHVKYWLQVVFIFFFMVLITAKMAILASTALTLFLIWKRFSYALAARTSLFILIIPVLITSVAMLYNINIYSRLVGLMGLVHEGIDNNALNYTSTRLGPIKCSLELIKRYGLMGFGTGDVREAMNAWYNSHLLPELLNYESHSNYLNAILSFGIIGIIVFIFILIKQLQLAISVHYTLYLLFIGLISVCSISENIFDLNKGVLFYALFISILTSYSYQKRFTNDSEY